MTILDIIAVQLEKEGYVCGPAFNPGCFFFDGCQGNKHKICLIRRDGKPVNISRTKEPTVILVYCGWEDDIKTHIIDLADPSSIDTLKRYVNG